VAAEKLYGIELFFAAFQEGRSILIIDTRAEVRRSYRAMLLRLVMEAAHLKRA
jgi:hypothetical protein